MLILAAALYLLIAPVLAGALVIVALAAPELGLITGQGLAIMAGVGFIASAPLALLLARSMRGGGGQA